MNVRVEYESTPIRHIAVQCPRCEKWFNGRDITANKLDYEHQIYTAVFMCPMCAKIFSGDGNIGYEDVHIEEAYYPNIYKDCLRKKEVWE